MNVSIPQIVPEPVKWTSLKCLAQTALWSFLRPIGSFFSCWCLCLLYGLKAERDNGRSGGCKGHLVFVLVTLPRSLASNTSGCMRCECILLSLLITRAPNKQKFQSVFKTIRDNTNILYYQEENERWSWQHRCDYKFLNVVSGTEAGLFPRWSSAPTTWRSQTPGWGWGTSRSGQARAPRWVSTSRVVPRVECVSQRLLRVWVTLSGWLSG